MPTPVTTAKQCLTPEAAQALDEAVAVARGRSHAQTTSLHAVSAFLSLPSSPIRDACLRTRNATFCYYSSPRSQIRALDFALSLSLDRSPVSQQRVNEPPISNSLMAAIKRAQANQRRQPDSFGFKQDQGREQLGTSGIKVEIQHLIVAILDDPIVSRVFNEAGFSSLDLKLAMVRPLQGFWRHNSGFNPRQRMIRPFRFPFMGDSGGDEDFRRVAEVLVRKQGRNPLLFGVCAYDALQGFVEAVERCKLSEINHFLPLEIRGVSVVSVEHDILKFMSENSGEEMIKSRFEELGALVEDCCGPGLMISFGDLKAFVKDDHDIDKHGVLLSSLVANFTKFIEVQRDRVWLIGCATYEIYLKFLNRFPSVEKDWDLQPLAMTSMKTSKGDMCFKSSMMGSFVPFAGFFPSSSDMRGTLRSSYQLPIRGIPCNEKRSQEVTTGSAYNSVADRCQSTLPSWLRMAEMSKSNRSSTLKAQDDAVVLGPMTAGCHSQRDERIQNFHSTPTFPMAKMYEKVAQSPPVGGKPSSEEEKAQIDNKNSHNKNAPITGSDVNSPLRSSPDNSNFPFRLSNRPSRTESPSPATLVSRLDSMLYSGVNDCQASVSSGTSVATDLVLGVSSHSCSSEKRESTAFSEKKLLQDLSSYSSLSRSNLDTHDFKSLFDALIRRIHGQEEAVSIISQTISHTRTSNGKLKGSAIRGDIWMNFIGSSTIDMRKTAMALAEVHTGSKSKLIHFDLSSQDDLVDKRTVFGSRLISCSDEQTRRKTMVDHIFDSFSKMPSSVVFLENLHLAHLPTQKSLLHAIRTGRFLDSHGREVAIGNAIFLLSSALETRVSSGTTSRIQDRVAKAKPWPMQIIVNPLTTAHPTVVPNLFNKRNLHSTDEQTMLMKRTRKGSVTCLDLNLPADEYAWLEELSSQVDVTVGFKPFDYDALSKKTSSLIQCCFSKSFCPKCFLEIDTRTIDQVLAAAHLSEKRTEVEDWVENVLSNSFADARKRYHYFASHYMVKLASIRPLYDEEEEEEACEWLPSKLFLHCKPLESL